MYTHRANMSAVRLTQGSPHRQTIETAFGIVTNVQSKVKDIRADGRFTTTGQADKIKSLLRDPLDHHAQLRNGIAKQLADKIAERGAHIPRPPDKTDVAGEMKRAEIRSHLLAQPEGKRLALAVNAKGLTRAAIVDADAFLSGVSEDVHGRLVADVIAETYGQRPAALEREIEDLTITAGAIEVSGRDLMRESGLDEAEFASLLASK
jgi:hypothetical protein